MTNPFPFTLDNKRYHTQNYELRKIFGEKVCKISLDGGFTCPNLDGTKGVGGCTYCSGRGSGDFTQSALLPIEKQWKMQQEKMYQKWPGSGCIAYFQAHTNTYAPLSRLKELYETALAQPNCVGLDIATRADCLSEEVCDYLAQLNRRCWLLVELGLQSTFDDTGEIINRCHSYADFLEGYARLKQRGIRVCIHLINGLPGENHRRMVENVRRISHLGMYAVKLHLLYFLKGTQMAEEYRQGRVQMMSREEYVQVVCDQLELLPPETVIHRLTGDGKKEELIGPLWSLKKFCVLNEIDKELVRRDSWQGKNDSAGGSGKLGGF